MSDKVYCMNCKHSFYFIVGWGEEEYHCRATIKTREDCWDSVHVEYALCRKVNKHNDCPKYELEVEK